MAGVYIHIPFCKSRCLYCGFYSTTLISLRQRYVDALCREMRLRSDYLHEPVRTIYVGGGTPSLVEPSLLEQLFESLGSIIVPSSSPSSHPFSSPSYSQIEEVTIECNPDDVTPDFAQALLRLPVNRVSMGAQTFSDARLHFLRRRHSAAQIATAVSLLRKAGIGNISIDLIYGFPGETLNEWHSDVVRAVDLGVEHLSAYSLMFEEGTPLYTMLQQGEVTETDEELCRTMFFDLVDTLADAGYEHYEISNFAKPSFRSRHNSSYWDGTPYLGLGAAAHSYNKVSRQWNVSDVRVYTEMLESLDDDGPQHLPFVAGCEALDAKTLYNDMVMTALRTCEGLSLDLLTDEQRRYCSAGAAKYVADGLLVWDGNERKRLRLSRSGIFVSDMIMSDLMMV